MRQTSTWNKQICAFPSRLELEDLHPCPEMYHSSCKGTFPACVRPGLHLLEWTRHNVRLSYFAGAHTVHWSGWGLQAPLIRSLQTSTATWIALNVQSFLILSLVIFCFSSRISPWGNLSCRKKQYQWRRASCASNPRR